MWTFFDTIDPARRQYLTDSPSFETVVGGLLLSVELVGYEEENFDEERLRGCRRASFLIDVPDHTYDLFYNGTHGYRAQYAADPDQGASANRDLVDTLAGALLTQANSKFDVDVDFARDSLAGSGAKVWIYEPEVHDHLFDDTPEIGFDRWLENSTDGAGLRAPIGTKLVVNGAWLDEGGREELDPYKANRSQEIYDVGFT